jgi:Predicted rRNA methylase
MIMAGLVMALPARQNFERVAKPGQILPGGTVVSVKERERFVSRGGYKLLTAIEHFNLDVFGKICLDAGASTGDLPTACFNMELKGFTPWTWERGSLM